MADPLVSASIWSYTSSWFTPTSLFLFLNLMIGTIVIISRFNSNTGPHEEIRPLTRAPSLIDRVKSINLSFHKYLPHNPEFETTETTTSYYTHNDPPQVLERAPSLLERVKSIKFPSLYRSEPGDEFTGQEQEHEDAGEVSGLEVEHHVTRSQSESGVAPERKGKAKEKMKKSASERTMDEPREVEDRESTEKRRPATTRLEKTASFGGENDGVDAKADDFINRFKQQLKLQRLDSLLRYRDMLKGK